MAREALRAASMPPSRATLWTRGAHVPVVLRSRSRSQRRQFPAAHAADLSRARGGGVPGPAGDRAWAPPAQLPRLSRPLEKARVGAGEARDRPRRHGRGHARQYAGDARMPLRRADVRRGAQYAEHPPRRRRARLHARPRRSEGADRRPRIFRRHGAGAEARQGSPARRRLRRSRNTTARASGSARSNTRRSSPRATRAISARPRSTNGTPFR